MQPINSLSSVLSNLSASTDRTILDPKRYEGFTVKVGEKTGPEGVLGGTLSQKDYDKFKEIVKNVNVKDASSNDIFKLYRELVDNKLINEMESIGNILGSMEFDSSGRGINYDSKYNQLEYQKKQLTHFTGPDFADSYILGIKSMKFIAAIANSSSVTGMTVAEHAYSPQERASGAESSNSGLHVQVSELAQRFSRGEKAEELNAPEDMDIAELIKMLEQIAQAQRTADAAKSADSPDSPT